MEQDTKRIVAGPFLKVRARVSLECDLICHSNNVKTIVVSFIVVVFTVLERELHCPYKLHAVSLCRCCFLLEAQELYNDL